MSFFSPSQVIACCEACCYAPTNFHLLFVAEGRIGNNRLVPGHAYGTHELALVNSIPPGTWCPHQLGQYVWSSGVPTAFTLSYNPATSIARFTIGESTSVWHIVASSPTQRLSVSFFVRSVRANSSIRLHNISVNGQPVALDITASINSQKCGLSVLDETFALSPLHVQGLVTMTFPAGAGRPNNNQLMFLILIGQTPTHPPPEDSDGDGLPDSWEEQYFDDPDFCAPNDDPDGDGLSNQEEYWAGTNPVDPKSNLQIVIGTAVLPTPPTRGEPSQNTVIPMIQWPATSNRTYSVWRATSLKNGMAGFSPLAERLPGTPPYNIFEDTTATGPGPYYYRVKVHLAP